MLLPGPRFVRRVRRVRLEPGRAAGDLSVPHRSQTVRSVLTICPTVSSLRHAICCDTRGWLDATAPTPLRRWWRAVRRVRWWRSPTAMSQPGAPGGIGSSPPAASDRSGTGPSNELAPSRARSTRSRAESEGSPLLPAPIPLPGQERPRSNEMGDMVLFDDRRRGVHRADDLIVSTRSTLRRPWRGRCRGRHCGTETATPLSRFGFKGIGESGTIGAPPAVQNAVVDALSHLGIRPVDLPLTAQRVWRAVVSQRAERADGVSDA